MGHQLLLLPGFPRGSRGARRGPEGRGGGVGFWSVADNFPHVGFAVQLERRCCGQMGWLHTLVCCFCLKIPEDLPLKQPEW